MYTGKIDVERGLSLVIMEILIHLMVGRSIILIQFQQGAAILSIIYNHFIGKIIGLRVIAYSGIVRFQI